ncbi:MAG: (d)CMP kinase [Deltaproteobacteria bacterium]|nr:(d)CMP kinase [Deltaproteobacteria bacterium]
MAPVIVIAVDGPGGVGKSTVSRTLAKRLGLAYVNTGAMYRAYALAAIKKGVDIHDKEALEGFCKGASIVYDAAKGSVSVNGDDYTEEVGGLKAGESASIISTNAEVRRRLVAYQRSLGLRASCVMEGRDIGTVVFPDAAIKFFLDAPPDVRAKRRGAEFSTASNVSIDHALRQRDKRDAERRESPLKPAQDAVVVDTAELDLNGVVDKLLEILKDRGIC